MTSSPHPSDNARTPVLDGMPPPRWNPKKEIYPSYVHTYLECPRQYRLQYVERIRFDRPWDRKMEVGNALHKVMEAVGYGLRDQRRRPEVETLRSIAEHCLAESEYLESNDLDLDDRRTDIANVLDWAERATTYITEGTRRIMAIETSNVRLWDQSEQLGEVRIAAKADLLLLREDEQGAYIEVVDYKSGYWQRGIDFTPTMTRISQKGRIERALQGATFPRVVFTYLWLSLGEVDRIELTRERLTDQWRELENVLSRIVHDDTWRMQPEIRKCSRCPYLNTECFPFPQQDAPIEADQKGVEDDPRHSSG